MISFSIISFSLRIPNNLFATTFPLIKCFFFFFQPFMYKMSGSSVYRNIDRAITKSEGTQKDLLL